MIKIGIVGDIGSGKSYVARQFGFPVFNADNEVKKIYKKNKKCFKKLKRTFPKYPMQLSMWIRMMYQSELACIFVNSKCLNAI